MRQPSTPHPVPRPDRLGAGPIVLGWPPTRDDEVLSGRGQVSPPIRNAHEEADDDEESRGTGTPGLDTPARGDGTRVLVDRIWPRGLAKTKADLHEWCKEVAPSTELP